MRWPRIRFTLGRMMAAVALAALAIGMVVRSRAMRDAAAVHDAKAVEHSQMMPLPQGGLVELLDDRGQWHRAMAETYWRVARFSFLPVWPGPPEPDWDIDAPGRDKGRAAVPVASPPSARLRLPDDPGYNGC